MVTFKNVFDKPDFAACYIKKLGGSYALWNTVLRNSFFEEHCGGDTSDWLNSGKYIVLKKEGEGIGNDIDYWYVFRSFKILTSHPITISPREAGESNRICFLLRGQPLPEHILLDGRNRFYRPTPRLRRFYWRKASRPWRRTALRWRPLDRMAHQNQ